MKLKLLKFLQIILFICSFSLFVNFTQIKVRFQNETPLGITKQENEMYLMWFTGLILFISSWSIGIHKVVSKTIVFTLAYVAIEEFIQTLPLEFYNEIKGFMGEGSDFTQFLPHSSISFSKEIVLVQLLIVSLIAVVARKVILADKLWLAKTIIIDWIFIIVAMLVSAIYDLTHQSRYFVLVMAYFFGANLLGFGSIKLCELLWNKRYEYELLSKNIHENETSTDVIFDTDDSIENNNNNGTTTTITATITKTNTSTTTTTSTTKIEEPDYSKLTEDELNELLSQPSPDHISLPPKTRFINNLIAPENAEEKIYSNELVGCIILWIYSMSNAIIQSYYINKNNNNDINIFDSWKLFIYVGFSTTLITYFTTISSKRISNKKSLKREA